MENSHIEITLQKRLETIDKFIHYLHLNSQKKAIRIKVDFEHPRFKDNKGLAVIELSGWEMNQLALALRKEAENQSQELHSTIKSLSND